MKEMFESTGLVALDGGKKFRGWRPVRWRRMSGCINQVDRSRNLSVNEMNEATHYVTYERFWELTLISQVPHISTLRKLQQCFYILLGVYC